VFWYFGLTVSFHHTLCLTYICTSNEHISMSVDCDCDYHLISLVPLMKWLNHYPQYTRFPFVSNTSEWVNRNLNPAWRVLKCKPHPHIPPFSFSLSYICKCMCTLACINIFVCVSVREHWGLYVCNRIQICLSCRLPPSLSFSLSLSLTLSLKVFSFRDRKM